MHMIGHQAVRPKGDAFLISIFLKQAKVEDVVVFAKKDLLPAVSTLDDMVRNSGNDDADDAGHLFTPPEKNRARKASVSYRENRTEQKGVILKEKKK